RAGRPSATAGPDASNRRARPATVRQGKACFNPLMVRPRGSRDRRPRAFGRPSALRLVVADRGRAHQHWVGEADGAPAGLELETALLEQPQQPLAVVDDLALDRAGVLG